MPIPISSLPSRTDLGTGLRCAQPNLWAPWVRHPRSPRVENGRPVVWIVGSGSLRIRSSTGIGHPADGRGRRFPDSRRTRPASRRGRASGNPTLTSRGTHPVRRAHVRTVVEELRGPGDAVLEQRVARGLGTALVHDRGDGAHASAPIARRCLLAGRYPTPLSICLRVRMSLTGWRSCFAANAARI